MEFVVTAQIRGNRHLPLQRGIYKRSGARQLVEIVLAGRNANCNHYDIKSATRILLFVLTTATFGKAGEIAVFEEGGAYYVKNLNRNWAVYFDLTWTNKTTGKTETRSRSLWPLNQDAIGDRKHITRPIPSDESFDPCHRPNQKRGRDTSTPYSLK